MANPGGGSRDPRRPGYLADEALAVAVLLAGNSLASLEQLAALMGSGFTDAKIGFEAAGTEEER
jgi:hypothetical protein